MLGTNKCTLMSLFPIAVISRSPCKTTKQNHHNPLQMHKEFSKIIRTDAGCRQLQLPKQIHWRRTLTTLEVHQIKTRSASNLFESSTRNLSLFRLKKQARAKAQIEQSRYKAGSFLSWTAITDQTHIETSSLRLQQDLCCKLQDGLIILGLNLLPSLLEVKRAYSLKCH